VREAVMDYTACNVVYVDRAAREDRLVTREDPISPALSVDAANHVEEHAPFPANTALGGNLQALLKTFSEGSSQSIPSP